MILFIFSFLQLQIMTRVSQRVVYNLRQDFEEKMRRVPIKYYDIHNNGDIMSRMVNDMDNIAGTLQQSLIVLYARSTSPFSTCDLIICW